MPDPMKFESWEDVFARFPGSRNELARALGVTRMTAWNLATRKHATPPYALLRQLVEVLRQRAEDGGYVVPTLYELLVLWEADRPPAVAPPAPQR